MRRIARYLATVLYKPLLVKYLSKERLYVQGKIRLRIHPEVFHPGFFFSTRILLQQLSGMHLRDKKMLELGAGSGLLSIMAAKAGAGVTATDINPVATEYLQLNMHTNGVRLEVIRSDLFTRIPRQVFDLVVINPPYYFDTPAGFKEQAWYCGRNGEYFHALFQNLSNYTDAATVILMVLCEGGHQQRIQSIAGEYGFALECIKTVRNLLERNNVYGIRAIPVNSLTNDE